MTVQNISTTGAEFKKIKAPPKPFHETLPPDLTARAGAVWGLVSDGSRCESLEKWADGFRYDMHPANEIAVWERIAAAYAKLKTDMKKAGLSKRKDLVGALNALVAASTGAAKPRKQLDDLAEGMQRGASCAKLREILARDIRMNFKIEEGPLPEKAAP